MRGFKSSRNNYSGGFTGLIDGIDSWEGVSRGLTRGYPGFTKDFGVIPGHRDGVFLGFTRGYPGLRDGVDLPRGFTRGYPGGTPDPGVHEGVSRAWKWGIPGVHEGVSRA